MAFDLSRAIRVNQYKYNLNDTELAEKLGKKTVSAVSHLRKRNNPRLGSLLALCDAFGISFKEFVESGE